MKGYRTAFVLNTFSLNNQSYKEFNKACFIITYLFWIPVHHLKMGICLNTVNKSSRNSRFLYKNCFFYNFASLFYGCTKHLLKQDRTTFNQMKEQII